EKQEDERPRHRRGRHQSAARRRGVRSQSGDGAAESDTQQGSTGSGRPDGGDGGSKSPVHHRLSVPRLAGGMLPARRRSPGLAAEARRWATGVRHSKRGGQGGSAGGPPDTGADL